MANMAYFQFYPESFLSGTRGLSRRHQALYALLLINMYADETDMIGASAAQKRLGTRGKVWTDFVEALIEEGCVEVMADGAICQPRITRELAAYQGSIKQRSGAGKASAEARRNTHETASKPFASRLQTASKTFANGFDINGVAHAPPDLSNENNGGASTTVERPLNARSELELELELELEQQNKGCVEGASAGGGSAVGAAEWTALIDAFDGAIVVVFGEAQARPWPNATDAATAQALHAKGFTASDVAAAADAACRRMRGQGKQPPATLSYLLKPLEAGRAAAGAVRSSGAGAAPKPARALTMRDQCYGWVMGGTWPDDLGPWPDANGCKASHDDLLFAARSDHPDRDRTRCHAIADRLGVSLLDGRVA